MTATLYAPTVAPETLAPPSPARLVRVELRKAVDTRAGRWLLVLIALVAVAGAVIVAVTGETGERNLTHVLGDTSQMVAVLLPVLGILLAGLIPTRWGLEFAAILALIVMTAPMFKGRPAVAGCVTAGVIAVLAAALPLKLGLVLAVIAGVAVAMGADRLGERDLPAAES